MIWSEKLKDWVAPDYSGKTKRILRKGAKKRR